MSKKHYRDYSKDYKNEETPVETPVEESEVKEETVEETAEEAVEEEVIEEPTPEPVEEVKEEVRKLYTANTFADEYKEGVVGCPKLNLRKAPEVGDNVITTIIGGSKVKIIEDNGEWLSIEVNKLGNRVRGFAMSKFINQ